MAITNNLGQTKVGVRVPLSVVIPTQSALLDSYSGAAAAYSLRKLTSTYTGSAIRVRRSSDNTEMDIGFDAGGNLDTVALSQFVGSGSGFVKTWYDQSGNSRNVAQTTAANQPSIVLSGVINTENSKPVILTDGNSFMINGLVPINGTTNSIFATIKMNSTRGNIAFMAGYGNDNQHFVSRNTNGTGRYYDSGGQEITASALPNGFNLISIHENSSGVTVYENNSNLVTNFTRSTNNTTGLVIFRRDAADSNYMRNGSGLSELIIYGNSSQLVNNSAISTNINSYYSVYPNPTSVWNLLTAVYSADTTGSSSLKTSLVASYNAESNTNDSFGTNNGTSQGGLTYVAGKIGNAFQFNGSNSYVSLPNDSLNFTGDFSVNAWFNTSTYTGLRGIASSYKVVGSLGYGWITYHDEVTNQFSLYLRDGSNHMLYRTNGGIPLNSYNMITWVRQVGQDPKIYINGVLSPGSYTFGNSSVNPSYQSGQPCNLGGWNNTSYGTHKQDGTTIWSKTLTQSEINELYNSSNGAQYIGDNFYKPTTNDALGINNGTAQGGLTYGTGKVGTAFQFNGTNAYVSLPDNSLNFTNKFSYSFWIKSNDTTNYGVVVGNVQSPRSPYSTFHGYEIGMESGKFFLFFRNGYGNQYIYYTTDVVNNGNWNHIVVTYDPTNPTTGAKIYVNGTLDRQVATLNPINYSSPMKACIGARNHSGSPVNFLPSGTNLDELNVWAKELTSSEVTELYNSGNGKQYPN